MYYLRYLVLSLNSTSFIRYVVQTVSALLRLQLLTSHNEELHILYSSPNIIR
jgi:hypothetical protein